MKAMNFDFQSRRSMVLARRGMVAASNPLASQAGLQILRQGGNAADAAIATAAVMNVVAPASTGIGGDCFAIYYDAAADQVTTLNGSGASPVALNIDTVRQSNQDAYRIDRSSPHAVTVPGAVRGWEDLIKRHGSLPLATILEAAIDYASEGYALSPVFGHAWSSKAVEQFLKASPYTEDYLPDGHAPQVGQIVRLPGLARTLQRIAEGGADAFYEGETAQAIVQTLAELGGLMSLDDLQAHRSSWGEPIRASYRGRYEILEHAPNGQGLTALIAMKIAEGWELAQLAPLSPERLHLMVEAMRLAFADAREYIADMDSNPAPIEALLSDAYIRERQALISPHHAMLPPTFGQPLGSSNTIYLSVVDGQGNACSFINSLYMGFGSGIVAKGTGVFLQNRGCGFVLDPRHANALQGHKRPYHTIIPGMAFKDGQFWSSFGVMGGDMQPQGHFQVLSAMIDDDLNPQEALDQPRWCLADGTSNSTLLLEEGIPVKTMSKLAELGHKIQPISGPARAVFGSGQIICKDDQAVLYGGSDPRKDGLVAAW